MRVFAVMRGKGRETGKAVFGGVPLRGPGQTTYHRRPEGGRGHSPPAHLGEIPIWPGKYPAGRRRQAPGRWTASAERKLPTEGGSPLGFASLDHLQEQGKVGIGIQPARDFPAGGGHFPGKECLFHRGKPEFWVKFQHCVVGKKIDEVNGSPIYLEDAFHQVPGEPPAPEIRAGHDRPQLDHGKGVPLPAKGHSID